MSVELSSFNRPFFTSRTRESPGSRHRLEKGCAEELRSTSKISSAWFESRNAQCRLRYNDANNIGSQTCRHECIGLT